MITVQPLFPEIVNRKNVQVQVQVIFLMLVLFTFADVDLLNLSFCCVNCINLGENLTTECVESVTHIVT